MSARPIRCPERLPRSLWWRQWWHMNARNAASHSVVAALIARLRKKLMRTVSNVHPACGRVDHLSASAWSMVRALQSTNATHVARLRHTIARAIIFAIVAMQHHSPGRTIHALGQASVHWGYHTLLTLRVWFSSTTRHLFLAVANASPMMKTQAGPQPQAQCQLHGSEQPNRRIW